MQHLDEGTIHAWLDGELPPDEAESAARHVAGCAECRALIVEARGLLAGASRIVSALDAGPASVILPAQGGGGRATTRRRPWYRFALTPARMSIAATIIAAVGLTFTARRVAEKSAVREMAGEKQSIAVSAPTPPAVDAIGDSIAALKKARTSANPKTLASSSAFPSSNADLSSSKPTALPRSKPQATDAAAFEAKTLHLDDRAVGNPSRQIAAAAAAPAAEPSPPATRLDTARAKDEMAKVGVDSLRKEGLESRRAFVAGNVNQLQEAVLTGRDASGATVVVLRDCYRLAVDSTSWRAILPSGFALTVGASPPSAERPAAFAAGVAGGAGRGGTAAGAAPRAAQQTSTNLPAAAPAPVLNTVRALDSTGRVSSRAIGFWFAGGADSINVRLATADAHKVASVSFAANGTMARVISSDRTDSVRVARTTCVR